jgi:hypothetical protein
MASLVAVCVVLGSSSVVSAAPAVFANGTFSVPASWVFDLDHGVLSSDVNAADAWFQIDNEQHHLITPIHADIAKFGGSKPTYKQCKNATLSGASWDADQNLAKWFCARTNKGRVNRFKVVSVSDDALVLKFTTWVN